MRILISGIHGYIGRNLVKVFHPGHTIYGLDFVTSEMEGVEKTYSYSDLDSIPEFDVLMHLAGKTVESYDLSKSLEYFENNAGMTRKIFKWFVHSSGRVFIYFSTVKAAVEYLEDAELTEDIEPKPYGPFGESKLLAEKYILEEWPAGKKVYILRSAIFHGPGRLGSSNLSKIYEWAKKGLPLPFGKFTCSRSFTSFDNLCFVLKEILLKDIASGIYNVADDESLALPEVFELMGYSLQKRVHIWHLNRDAVCFLFLMMGRLNGDGKNAERQLQRLTTSLVVSNDKIKKALGIKRMPYSVVDSYLKTLASFNKNRTV